MSTEGASQLELEALAAALQILSQVLDETRIVLEETNKVYEETNNLTIPEAAEQARLRRQVQQVLWAKLRNRS